MSRSRLLALGLVVLILLGAIYQLRTNVSTTREEPGFDPTTWFAPQWEDLLGGDSLTPNPQLDLAAIAATTDLPGSVLQPATRLFYDLTTASASGLGRDEFGTYFARNHPVIRPTSTSSFCTEVSVEAVSAFYLPVAPRNSLIKALVLWRGNCPYPPPSITPAGSEPLYLNFLYAAQDEVLSNRSPERLLTRYNKWVPARPAELPGSNSWQKFSASTPAPFELNTIPKCAVSGIVARIEVAVAYMALCAEAEAAGMPLMAVEGYRTPADQKALYDAARKRYGSDRAARARVAYSDGYLCESMHCAAEAIDLAPNADVAKWLSAPVACLADGVLVSPPCAPATTPVTRLERYGFTAPHPQHGYHLEYVLGTLSADADLYGDCTPGGQPVAARIDLIFRCRLLEGGLGAELASIVAKEATLVATCTSGLDPGFTSYGGAYASTPNPLTGSLDDRVGIFGLSAAVVSRWVPPNESPLSASSNIDAAARIFVDERSWGGWGWNLFACAAADDGLVQASVLQR